MCNGIKKLTPQARPAPSRGKREQRKRLPGIIGTGAESRISVITTKRVSIFATRFSPDVDAETLRSYQSEKLANKSVACRKIESHGSRYGSFHVTADCKEVADMYSPTSGQWGCMLGGTLNPVDIEYICRGLRTGNSAVERARRVEVDRLLQNCDILCLQETFLSKQDLGGLNCVHEDFHGSGE